MVMLKQKIPESPDAHPQYDQDKEAHDADRDKASCTTAPTGIVGIASDFCPENMFRARRFF